MCDLNIVMTGFCSCLHPTQDPCIKCKKPLWNAERQATECGGCDRNQNELCSNCPNRIQDIEQFIILTTRREAESVEGDLGFKLQESHISPPQPVEESFAHFACRLLRLERNKGDAIDIITMIPEAEKFLRRFWEKTYPMNEKDCRIFISQHPFMQYLTMLLKIRVVSREASFYQLAHVVEGIARL